MTTDPDIPMPVGLPGAFSLAWSSLSRPAKQCLVDALRSNPNLFTSAPDTPPPPRARAAKRTRVSRAKPSPSTTPAMPSRPDPDRILFYPLEGKRLSGLQVRDLLAAKLLDPAKAEDHLLPITNCIKFGVSHPGGHVRRFSPARKPRPKGLASLTVLALIEHIDRVAAIKNSAAACVRCVNTMQRYWGGGEAAGGTLPYLLKRSTPGARPIRAALPIEQGSEIGLGGRASNMFGSSVWIPLLRQQVAGALTRVAAGGGPSQRSHHRYKGATGGTWPCPYCAVRCGGKQYNEEFRWPLVTYKPAPIEPIDDPTRQMIYALPYVTTHLLAMTQRIIPPPVSHLNTLEARNDLVRTGSRYAALPYPRSPGDRPEKPPRKKTSPARYPIAASFVSR